MLHSIKAECYKIKKSRIVYVCSGLVILSMIWIACKEMIASTPTSDFRSWLQAAAIFIALFLSIASGFVITVLIQQEYEYKTLINVLTAPTSRVTFILSKLMVWLMWYLLVLAIGSIVLIIGGFLLFPGDFGINEIGLLLSMIVKTRVFSFIASMPLLLVAVLQRHAFYPTIMCTLAFCGMELLSLILPVKYACMIPWSAAMLAGLEQTGGYLHCAAAVILLSGILGIGGACFAFMKQNQ